MAGAFVYSVGSPPLIAESEEGCRSCIASRSGLLLCKTSLPISGARDGKVADWPSAAAPKFRPIVVGDSVRQSYRVAGAVSSGNLMCSVLYPAVPAERPGRLRSLSHDHAQL